MLLGGSPTLQSGGKNQQWPTSGPGCDITLAAQGVGNTSQRGKQSTVAHNWATWRHNPRRLWGPQRFKAGERNKSGSQLGGMAT